jgi:membrane-associated protease RseP (regulator of RpoE activity)
MSFLIYDLSFLVVFSLAIAVFLYLKKTRITKDGWMYLYKTRVGLKIIDYLGTKNKKLMKVFSYIIIATGYVLMVIMLWLLYQMVKLFLNPAFIQAVKIPPLMPLIPYLPSLFKVTWLPPFYFTYWIIAIALVAIFHEGFHGVFARFNNVRIKSTGFGFLGPFLAFFVEQDDKQMQRKKIFPQLTILGAGVFANVLLGIIFFFIMIIFFGLAYAPAGVNFDIYTYEVVSLNSINFTNTTITSTLGNNYSLVYYNNQSYLFSPEIMNKTLVSGLEQTLIYQIQPAILADLKGSITEINNKSIKSVVDLSRILESLKPDDKIELKTKYTNVTSKILTYNLTLGADYQNNTRAVLGIAHLEYKTSGLRGFLSKMFYSFKDPSIAYEPKANPDLTLFIYNLFWWIVLINFSVALTNMLPMGIFDGGRFFYLTVLAITHSKKTAEFCFKWATKIILLVFLALMLLWAWGIFLK